MRRLLPSVIVLCGVCTTLMSCTERRRMTEPTPDGDTVEVVIPDKNAHNDEMPVNIIDLTETADTL